MTGTRVSASSTGTWASCAPINTYEETLQVEYDEHRVVTYPFELLDELELAYAITIHKSQGSEYPAAVIPLLAGAEAALQPEPALHSRDAGEEVRLHRGERGRVPGHDRQRPGAGPEHQPLRPDPGTVPGQHR